MTTKPTAPRAVLYLRQSTYKEESISLEMQEHATREHARRMGYTVVGKLEDPGVSGRTWNRPAVQQVMRMIEAGEADRIILWKWSRLSRDRYDWPAARKIVETAGGRIESATEPNDVETPEGRLMLDQMVSFAVYESEKIGSVWKDTHARRIRHGLPHDGQPRYGYRKLEDRSYAIDPETGPLLAEMYARYLAGEGFSRIARTMNKAGHHTLAGRLWGRTTLSQTLDAGFGAGLLVRGVRGPQGRRQAPSYVPGAQEPVIDADTWEQYRAKRALTPQPPRVIEPAYFLTGLVRCGECGGSMFVRTGGNSPHQYVCSRARKLGDVPGVSMRRALVEQLVTEWVLELADDVTALAHAEARATTQRARTADSRAAVDAKIAATDQRMAALTLKWLDGKMPESAYQATIAALNAERAGLTARQATSEQDATIEYDIRKMAIHLASAWDDIGILPKRAALAALVDRVIIHPASRPGTGVWRERVTIVPAWDREGS